MKLSIIAAMTSAALLTALPTAPALAEGLTADQTARTLAGLDVEAMSGDAARKKLLKDFSKEAQKRWKTYWKAIGGPMTDWSREAVPSALGETVFYPFSGPDFPTAMQVYPAASRFVLVALQNAGPVPNLRAMPSGAFTSYMRVFRRGWVDFARRGFFRTDDLKADTSKQGALEGVTPVLMAFASALGFSVDSVTPIRINAEGTDLEPHPGDKGVHETWDSVRLSLRRPDGATVILDYVQLDISDGALKKKANARAWLATVAQHKTLTKAASHLMQKPFFSTIRDIVLAGAPVLVQDETGVDYKDLVDTFDIQLFGRFERAHKLFYKGVQRELAEAYKKRKDVKPLPFKFGYEKDKGSAVMVATRR